MSWGLPPRSECLGGPPAVQGNLGQCPRARVVHHLSRATQARVAGPTGSTIYPGRPGPGFQCPRGLPPVLAGLPLLRWHAVSTGIPGKLRSGLRPRGVDQQARLTRAHVPGPSGSTRYPGRPGPGFQCPRARPAVLAALGLALKARGFDPLSRATRALFRGTAVSTSSPGHLANRCDIPRCGRAVLGDSGQGPMARGNHQHSWVTISPGQLATVSEIPRSRPAVPCDPGPGPRSQV